MKQIFILRILLLFLFFPLLLKAQITLDASSSRNGTSVSSITWTHTISSPADILLVSVTSKDKAISSVTWGGTPLLLAGTKTQNSMVVSMYYLTLPAWGTKSIVVTTAGGTDIFAGAESYINVDYTLPFSATVTASGKSSAASTVIASSATELVVDATGCIAANITAAAGQTQRHNTGSTCKDGSSTKPGSAVTSMLWNLSANEDWAMVVLSMRFLQTLPIQLLSFEAANIDSAVKLNWTTATEINNAYYTVQRSWNASAFEDIGRVNAVGNSLVPCNYEFTDKQAGTGIIYYRLKQIDLNGQFSFSNIVAINVKKIEIIQFYPNPAKDVVRALIVSPAETEIELIITAEDGRILSERTDLLRPGSNNVELDVSGYAEGNYIFSIKDKYRTYSTKQFLVRN